MKKKIFALAIIGVAAGLVGCAVGKNQAQNTAPKEEPASETDSKEAESGGKSEDTALQDEDKEGSKNNSGEEAEVHTVEDSMENFVTYYGCPNSKRIAKLNTKKNLMRIKS